MATFIPDRLNFTQPSIPYFEDSKEREIKGHRAEKSLEYYQSQIATLLYKLGGMGATFMPGKFASQGRQREGFRIAFTISGNPARIDCAALPLRTHTDLKQKKALAQALFLLRNELDAMALAWVYKPESMPLISYLVGPTGQTMVEALIERGDLPALGSGA